MHKLLALLIVELRRYDTDAGEMDELVVLSAVAKMARAEYTQHELDVPEWLTDRIRTVEREIEHRKTDDLEKQLRQAVAARGQAMTAQEKRDALDTTIADLKKKLGITDAPAQAAPTTTPA